MATAATNPSSRSSSPPWPGMIWLESFTPKRRFTADLKRSPSCETTESTPLSISSGPVLPEIEHGKAAGHREACDKAADGASPRSFGADARPEFRPANAAAGEIAAAISHPDDQQHEDQRDEAFDGIEAQQHRSDLAPPPHRKIRSRPSCAARREQDHRHKPDREHAYERGIDPPDGETKSGDRKRCTRLTRSRAVGGERPPPSAIRRRGRSRPASPARSTASRRHRRWQWRAVSTRRRR